MVNLIYCLWQCLDAILAKMSICTVPISVPIPEAVYIYVYVGMYINIFMQMYACSNLQLNNGPVVKDLYTKYRGPCN